MLSEGSDAYGAKTFQYDAAGRRTRITFRDGFYVTYDYLVTGEMSAIKESGVSTLAAFSYDDLGRRTLLGRGNGTYTHYSYDPVSRLAQLGLDFPGTANDVTTSFAHNPAGQIVSSTRDNDLYAWTGHGSGTTASSANGLNQLTQHGASAIGHDGRGNTNAIGASTYGYTAENLLATVNGGPGFAYDATGRLYYTGATAVWNDYDGDRLLAEIPWSGNIISRRYIHGPGTDEPLVWYEGSDTSDRRFLHADERGSIIAVSDIYGNVVGINKYDEYGKPAAGNIGRFQYTGQTWLPEIGLYYYKARM